VLVLALDTSSAAVSAAVVEVGYGAIELVSAHRTINARGHGEYLAPMIRDSLHDAGATTARLGAIVAGTGPGPFTGLRVGLVTAAVMSQTLDIPVYGVCSLDGLAASDGSLLVATDARRREVYWARYDARTRVDGPHVSKPADVPLAGIEAAAGAGARLYAEVLGLPIVGDDYPDPARLVGVARDRIESGAPADPLTPLYLRRPDAEIPGAPKAVSQ
jgi:tRNA threonylcarbamoyl adenosine modification protein YeaZ